MVRVSTTYSLTRPVPFVDVHVDIDNALYLDPSAIRNDFSPDGRWAHSLLIDFFQEVLRLRRSVSPADHSAGLGLLNFLHEPNETRLGLSTSGSRGTAFGPGLAEDLWDVLGAVPAARTAALTRLEHLPIFVRKVGPDLISDLTTRVVYPVLADFTSRMMTAYPAMASATSTEDVPFYDPAAKRWVTTSVTLPLVAGRQLLLIPKSWVGWKLQMDYPPFYNNFATETVKFERGTYDSRGRFLGPSKEALNIEFRNKRGLNNDQAAKYMQQGRNLTMEYQAFVDNAFEPLSDDEMDRRTPPAQ